MVIMKVFIFMKLWKIEKIVVCGLPGPIGTSGWTGKRANIPHGHLTQAIITYSCEGGESARDLSDRADAVVNKVKEIHTKWLQDPERNPDDKGGDVLVVSHGHFSRCLLTRWLGLPLSCGNLFSLDPGGVSGDK